MGLASFNRMRLRRVEEMRPENIEQTNKKEVEKMKAAEPAELPVETVEENNVTNEVPKRTRRK